MLQSRTAAQVAKVPLLWVFLSLAHLPICLVTVSIQPVQEERAAHTAGRSVSRI